MHTIEASGYLKGNLTSGPVRPVHPRPNRTVKTVRVGRLSGACRGLKKRFRAFDFRPVAAGTYRVTFDTNPFSDDNVADSPGYRRVKVRRRIG